MSFYLEKVQAIVTGASSGFGEAYASRLAPVSENLCLVARRKKKLEILEDKITIINPDCKVHILNYDLTEESSVEKIIIDLSKKKIVPNLLINNAGVGDIGSFHTCDLNKIIKLINLNIISLTKLTRYILPVMQEMNYGGIINVSSVSCLLPLPLLSVYAASKAYVTSFSEALHLENRKYGVHITAVCPGPVHTEFRDSAYRDEESKTTLKNNQADFLRASIYDVIEESLDAIVSNNPRVYPGTKLKYAAKVMELLPPSIQKILVNLKSK